MLKLPVGGVITLKSSRLVPSECAMVSGLEGTLPATKPIVEEMVKMAINPEYPEQTVMIGSTFNEEGRKRLCDLFQHAYKGYHQIQMAKEDEEKTVFITSQGIFCYTKMPFGMRNAGVTYQRLVDKAFHKQIRRISKYTWMTLSSKACTFTVEEGRRCGRRIQSQHQRAESMSRQGRRCLKSSIPKMFERRTKVKLKARKSKQTTEAEEAFKQMKQLIAELPMLTAPMEKEELIVYLAAAKETGFKRPRNKLYINGKVGAGLGTCVLSRPEVAGRLQKWSIELGEYAIHYRLRVSVKGQILADFIVERPEEDSPDTLMETEEELLEPWILFTDESSCTDGFREGLILTNPEGMEFTYALRFRFDGTNNKAEYEALIAGLRIAEQMGVKNLQANVDSRLVANQVNGTYVAKEANMIRYLEKVKILTSSFKTFSIRQVPRSGNKKADSLRKITSTSFAHLSKQVLVEELKEKSIGEVEILAVVEEGDTWMTPIFKYLTKETLPVDVKKARAVRCMSQRFVVINGTLYNKSFLGPWLRHMIRRGKSLKD
ncbi:reverse transcriptase domain-containing protein [Tanacetum coccineum]